MSSDTESSKLTKPPQEPVAKDIDDRGVIVKIREVSLFMLPEFKGICQWQFRALQHKKDGETW